MDWVLVCVRAIHIASTVSAAGGVLFQHLIAATIFAGPDGKGCANGDIRLKAAFARQLDLVVRSSVALCALSGVAWLVVVAAGIAEVTPWRLWQDDTLGVVIAATRFGHVSTARAGVLAALAFFQLRPSMLAGTLRPVVPVALACVLLASLAGMGHSGAGAGFSGNVLLASDALHLIAAGAWIGGLLPLALLLGGLRKCEVTVGLPVARMAALRFSALGAVCVATVLATGFVNSLLLIGSIEALLETGFGQMLLAKLSLVAVLLGLAAVNRFWLTPQLDGEKLTGEIALRHLTQNSFLEAVVGLAIMAAVAALGTIPPAGQFYLGHHH